MNESTVNIKLNTTANTSGADKLNASLGITATREKELAAMRTQFLSAAEAEVAKVNQLAEASRKLAAAKEAEAAASKRQPLLAEGLERERQEVERLIAAQRQLAAERSKPAANPWTTATGNAFRPSPVFIQQLNDLDAAQKKVTTSSRNFNNALLQGSRGLQDAMYGWQGAINNAEGLATALGLSSAVAGGITILAVAAQAAAPFISEFFASLDTSKIQTDGLKSFVEQLGLVSTGRDRAAIAGEKFKNQLAAEDAALKAQMAVIKENTALFNLRNAAAQGQAEFEAQQAIEDIRAQGLPREVEAAAIAEKKLALLERQAELQKAASDQAIAAAQQNAALANEAAVAAQKEVQRLEEIITRSAELERLKKQEIELQNQLNELQREAALNDRRGFSTPGQEQKIRAAEAALTANRAGQAAANRGALSDASTQGIYQEARNDAAAKARAAAEAAEAIGPANRMAAAMLQVSEQRQKQERQRIEREAALKPVVMDGRNYIDVPPKPRERVEPDEWELASRVQPVQRPRRNLAAEEAAGRGGFQGRNLAAEEKAADTAPLNKAADSSSKLSDAILNFAQTATQRTDETARKLKELEAKMKASRP